ncbi:anamorsin homolog [Durio zibethinus]|uniref:Anamorsin homolog n=1 Tax=Durio zibethinus TaxID=66656 RepID=A0A6P6B1V3_DURZI|nr:anamorsin homolog [Durio zibethinus]
MDSKSKRSLVLAITDDASNAVSSLNAIWDFENEDPKRFDPLIIMQASSLVRLPLESSYVDMVIFISRSDEFPVDELYAEIFRVLMPGGMLVVYGTLQSGTNEADMVMSAIERKLLLAGFLEGKCFQLKSVAQSFGVKAKKPSWKIGSSFAIKKTKKNPLKIQIDDDSDLIDEDSLLTEEDLKKPQLPPAGDCEVGSTRKACKNCTCGRAEQEEKVQKLELTMDQLNNPQSACGNCGLGDAFRCSTCPYKGLPPFKLGEKVSLSGNFLTADI